jgi:hypothetical protein
VLDRPRRAYSISRISSLLIQRWPRRRVLAASRAQRGRWRPSTPPEPVRLPPSLAAGPGGESQSLSADTRTRRSCDILGWLGLTAGVAVVLVTALTVPLDDAGLALAAALVVRGGRLILDG